MYLRIPFRSAVAALLLAIIIVCAAAPRPRTATYIGIYADEGHSECSLYPALYQVVYFWVWIQPGEDGMICAEYEIGTPATVIQAAAIVNPEAGYQIGDAIVPPGATVCFPSCRTGWTWTHQLTCLVMSAVPAVITLEPHGDYGIMRATDCSDDLEPYDEMIKLNDMFLFQGCCMSDTESSWGAVKSILR